MSPARHSVVVVRPYGERIRARVSAVLSVAGFDIRSVLPAGTSDDDALAAVLRLGEPRLVIPFHAHRDDRGGAANGLTLTGRVAEAVPGARIVMPVSSFGAAAVSIAVSTGVLPQGVLLLPERELDQRDVVDRVREHLRGAGR